jgi:transposase
MKANTKIKPQTEDRPEIKEQAQGHGEKLSRKAEQAIVALLAHPTIPEAAKACGVSETTLWRWLQRDEFQKRYRDAQDKVFDGALGSLQGAMTEAVDCLRRNLTCGTPSAEVQAAKAILDFTMKARELLDITERVKELEKKLVLRGGFAGK